MIKCSELARHATAYLDGDLPRYRRWSVRVHLLMCKHCRRFVRQIQLAGALLRQSEWQRPVDPLEITSAEADAIVRKALSSRTHD